MRPLVEAGKLYRGAAPLYTVKIGKEEQYFYTDKAYQTWLSTNTKKFSVLRGKGVGELEAQDLNRLCFASERFKRLSVDDLKATNDLLNIFLGTDVSKRKSYIYNNATEIGFMEG